MYLLLSIFVNFTLLLSIIHVVFEFINDQIIILMLDLPISQIIIKQSELIYV